MQNRKHFLQTGFSLAAAGLAGVAALGGARRTPAEEAPPETTSLRLGQFPVVTCIAPFDILDDLLREEGFADVRYVPAHGTTCQSLADGETDFGQDFSPVAIVPLDAGAPICDARGGAFWLF
jgi:NitT/TauT family transport system substrate-binding protein